MVKRAHNFSAGPCTLPLSVLEEVQNELTNYKDSGMSVIELSHRGKLYDDTHNEAMALTREVFQVPEEFEVMFLQGGATLQFSMIPMNILKPGEKAAYVHSGQWAKKAFSDAQIYGDAYLAWDGKPISFSRMPKNEELELQPSTKYLHVTSNETIGGIRMIEWPDVDVPLVGDMSSDFMTRYIPWEKFDIVYGGAQKNLGPAGMTLVFIRKTLLNEINKNQGAYLRYDIHADKRSIYNTPPVFSIYFLGKMMKWMKDLGGIEEIEKIAEKKSSILYDYIDNSDGYYTSPVETEYRSLMNIVFRLPSEELEAKFLKEAEANNFFGLKGHRSVGGCRASCYNSMPEESVYALRDFMVEFKKNNPA